MVEGQGHILGVQLAEALEGEILKRRAVGDERNETTGAESAGGERELREEKRAVEGEGVEAFVGDVDAALEFQLLERSQERRDSRQRQVVDAHNLPRTFQRQNRNGTEPTKQRREERRHVGASKQNQPLPRFGIHRPPPPAHQRARVSVMTAQLPKHPRQALVRQPQCEVSITITTTTNTTPPAAAAAHLHLHRNFSRSKSRARRRGLPHLQRGTSRPL